MIQVYLPKLRLISGNQGESSTVPLDTNLSFTDLKKQWSDSFEKTYLVNILDRHGGNVSAAARQSRAGS